MNSKKSQDFYQNCLALGLSLGLICGAIVNNLGVGLIMGMTMSFLFNKGYFKSR